MITNIESQSERTEDAWNKLIKQRDDLIAGLEFQTKLNDNLASALQRYGQHLKECIIEMVWFKEPCSCGFQSMLDMYGGSKHD